VLEMPKNYLSVELKGRRRLESLDIYWRIILKFILNKLMWGMGEIYITERITIARVLNVTDTLRKTGGMLMWGSHRPPHGVENVKSSAANDETGFKVLTLTLSVPN
jgi:uncharacterized membrane protein